MADITDPIVLKWINEDVRPVAERLRDVLYKLETLKESWDSHISTLLAPHAAGDIIAHGRENLREVTKADLSAMLAELATTLAQYPDLDVLRKFEVRSPRIGG